MINQYFKNLTKDEPINEICELQRKFPGIKDYYQMRLIPHRTTNVVENHKK